MCGDCGCSEGNKEFFEEKRREVHLGVDVLKKNNDLAHDNWHWFDDRNIKAINIMSSPGSGKTTLLEKTLPLLKTKNVKVLVGDQETDNDAKRLKEAGVNAKQISTFNSCHLDAEMIANELETFVDKETELLIIENVGNLVCPSAFDLGEKVRVALLSVTEGEDKPLKYPVLFHKADIVVITKCDLLPFLDWDMEACIENIRTVNPKAKIIKTSAKDSDSLNEWVGYLNYVSSDSN